MRNNKKPRGAKTATLPDDHLRDVPTPLHAGKGLDWQPAEALRAKAAEAGVTSDDPGVKAAIAHADAAWSAYRKALRAADLARFGDPALTTPATRKRRLLDVQNVYNRARLGAWTASLGRPGLERWALKVAEHILAQRIRKRIDGVTIDLLPDLPRRCDLTDAAIEGAKALEQGEHWATIRPGIEDAADAVVNEALEDMGWRDE